MFDKPSPTWIKFDKDKYKITQVKWPYLGAQGVPTPDF